MKLWRRVMLSVMVGSLLGLLSCEWDYGLMPEQE